MKKKAPPMSMPPMAPAQKPQAGQLNVAAQAPAPAPMAPMAAPAPAAPSLQRGTHNPENNLPAHAFHGKKR